MKFKTKFFNKVIVAFLCVAMIIGSFNIGANSTRGIYFNDADTAYAAELSGSIDESIPDNIQDGAMLQAFCWSFNTIKDNMDEIAAAGYTAVQTSPIQACLATFPTMTIGGDGHWYYHYQPTDFTIGNYQVGTEAEFQLMCSEADKYGIKIVVDVVPNHTTVDTTKVSENLINAVGGMDKLYHAVTGLVNSENYSDRLECTRNAIGKLPDIDTENVDFQNYFIKFLNQCIADGADGFRYDSAKHIGAPNDPRPEGVVNNFYERVTTDITNAENIFNYGEVLQGSNDGLPAYEDAIGATTASDYGANIRTALAGNNYMVSNISEYMVDDTVDPDNLVTWVESHDNYYNDGTWSRLDNAQIILGWAIVTARANGTPLFFSRPYGSSLTSQYGTNTIGIAGDDTYKNDQVVAVNKFRNAMVGEAENLTNPGGNAKVLMIERGTKGAVIVNGNYGNYALDTETNLADGTYINRTADNSVFTVINGEISGVLPARSVIVLYGAEATNSTTVHFYNGSKWGAVSAYVSGSEILGAYPGTKATKDGDGWWRVTVPADVADGFEISFNDGGDNQTSTFTVDDGTKLYYTSSDNIAYAAKAAAETAIDVAKTTVYFFNSGSWANVNAYVWGSSEVLGGWPGVEAKSDGDGWWRVDIPAAPSAGLNVIFHNNGSQTGDILIDNSTDVYITNDSATKYDSKLKAEAAIEYDPDSVTVYFYNNQGWSEVGAYTWGAATLGEWPGTAATYAGDDWWKITIPAPPSMNMNVIFNSNDNVSKTGTIIIANITNRYTCAVNTTAYPSKATLLAAHGFDSTQTDVYFYNNNDWDNVYASVSKDGELLEADPGTLATEQANNWWRVTIPSGVSDNLTVTFNNGSSDNKSDTFTVNNRNNVYYTGVNNAVYVSKIAAETAIGVELSTIKVSFYNSSNWAAVGAYVYGPGQLLGAWPGTKTTDEGSGWSSIIIPYSESTGLHVIFNSNGSGNQSGDFVIADAGTTYVTNFSNEMYASKAAAEEDNAVVNKTLVSFVSSSAITVLTHATEKTAKALTLPLTVALTTEDGEFNAKVTWNLSECTYDPTNIAEQTFAVNGIITLPLGVVNPNSVGLVISIHVTVGAVIVDTLVSVVTPSAITVASHATEKTAEALTLPSTVTLTTDDENATANVTWDISTCTYDPANTAEQSFTVSGTVTLPVTVVNPNSVGLVTTIHITVGAAIEADNTLVSVVTPSAITVPAHATEKTAEALTLPSTVTLTTDDENATANVTWDLSTCTYDPANTAEQSFTVSGTVTLPVTVVNPNSVGLVTTINVTVGAAIITDNTSGSVTPPVPSNPQPVNGKLEIKVSLGENGALPAENIINQIADTDGKEVNLSVQLPKYASHTGFVLTTDILNAAKKADKTLSVTVKDENNKELYTWSFDKDALSLSNNDMKDVDLTLDVEALSDEETLSNTLGSTGLVMSFAYDGVLPAQASVKVYVGNQEGVKAGSKVLLYHYNRETGKLETLPYSSNYIVDEAGYVTIQILHCSDYVVLTKEAPVEMITSLKNQIMVTPTKKTLYFGGTTQNTTKIEIELPETLELVNDMKDTVSQSAKGAVTAAYTSNNSKVATVDKNGMITAVGMGKATITTTLTLYSGKIKKVKTIIIVKKPYILLNSAIFTIKVGGEFTFTAKANGVNVEEIEWSTTEKSILVIDKNTGKAIAKSKGKDYVIAKVGDVVKKIRAIVE